MGKAHSRPCISISSNVARRLILKLHNDSGDLVAHCIFPHKFIVTANGKHNTGVGYREPPAHTELRHKAIQPEFPVPNPPPAPVSEIWSHFRPVSVHEQPQINSNYPDPDLHRFALSEGPVSGGPTILLSGTNFPSPQMVYARFGTVVVPTVCPLLLSPQNTNPFVALAQPIHARVPTASLSNCETG